MTANTQKPASEPWWRKLLHGSEDDADTTSTGTPRYAFEGWWRKRRHRSEGDARRGYDILIRRLLATGQTPPSLDPAHERDLLDFVSQTVLNIDWYQRRLLKEYWLHKVFVALTVALLAAIPLVLAFAGGLADEPASQIAAVLTGLIGVHRTIAAWLDKRRLLALFSEASAELKTILYEFEAEWRGALEAKTPAHRLRKLARRARQDAERARRVVLAEQRKFFTAVQPPTADLGRTLADASKQAVELVDRFAPDDTAGADDGGGPRIDKITPVWLDAARSATPIRVTASGFTGAATVILNRAPVASTVDRGDLVFELPADLRASPGSVEVAVETTSGISAPKRILVTP